MARKTVSTLVVEVSSNISEALSGLDKVGSRAAKMGKNLRRTGFRMSRQFTAPLAAIGGAALKVSSDFEQSMKEVQTLVGLSSDEVAGMREEILQLGPAVGKGPKELSDALFSITSGGLRGAEAMQVLEQSAKASALGLGNMESIGRAATAALNAFGSQGLTATEAVDTMVATVRSGNLEADSLAGSLGKVTGIASSLGVSFADVNAFLATFTKLGVDTSEATTALRGVFSALMKTTDAQEETFQRLGTSADELVQKMGDEGVAQTLIELVKRAKETGVNLSEVIPNVRALSGVLGTAGAQSETFTQVQADVRDALGLTDEGFKETQKTIAQTMNRMKSAVQVLLIAIGDAGLTDAFTGVIEKITEFVRWLSDLSPTLVRVASIVAAVVAAIGPLLLVTGKLIGAFVPLISVVGKLGAFIAGLSNPVGIAIVAATALTAAWIAWGDEIKSFVLNAVDSLLGGLEWLTQLIPGIGDKVTEVRAKFSRWADGVRDASEELGNLSRSMVPMVSRTISVSNATGQWAEKQRDASRQSNNLANSTDKLSEATSTFKSLIEETKSSEERLAETRAQLKLLVDEGRISQEQMNAAMEVARQRLEDAREGTDRLTDAERRRQEQIRMAQAAVEATRTKQEEYRQQLTALDVALKQGEISQSEYNRAVQAAEADLNGLSEAMRVYDGLIEETKTKEEKLSVTRSKLTALVDAGRISQDQMNAAMAVARERMGELEKGSSSAGAQMEQSFGSVAKGIARNFVQMATTASSSISGFVKSALSALAKLAFSKVFKMIFGAAAGPLGGIIGGGVGSLLGGFFAKGGFLPAGQFGIVGEEGPEVVRATSTGVHIEPIGGGAAGGAAMAGAGGGGGTQEFVIRPDLSGLPDPPQAMTPDAVAVDTYWRQVFSRLAIDGRDRGVL